LNCSDSPKISIGLPVFNGQQYLDEAVASIMSQTYSNFELIIADNCSTDNSLAIAKRWQEIDHRI
jgi:glycosyltransferase involved in cell wall biosynthesis